MVQWKSVKIQQKRNPPACLALPRTRTTPTREATPRLTVRPSARPTNGIGRRRRMVGESLPYQRSCRDWDCFLLENVCEMRWITRLMRFKPFDFSGGFLFFLSIYFTSPGSKNIQKAPERTETEHRNRTSTCLPGCFPSLFASAVPLFSMTFFVIDAQVFWSWFELINHFPIVSGFLFSVFCFCVWSFYYISLYSVGMPSIFNFYISNVNLYRNTIKLILCRLKCSYWEMPFCRLFSYHAASLYFPVIGLYNGLCWVFFVFGVFWYYPLWS